LQSLFESVYETGRFADTVDYSAEPAVGLTPADAAWAGELIRANRSH
jgi:hypothetical protein